MAVGQEETDHVETGPVGTDHVEADRVEAEPVGAEPVGDGPKLEATALADLTATVSAMGRQLKDLSAAVVAIANQGSVNRSVGQDSRETDGDKYPTIDIDGINRLLGV